MARPPVRRRLAIALAVAMVLSVAIGIAPVATRSAVAAEPPLPAWTGRVDLYRSGQFTTQKSWLWCTAAGVQIVRNIVEGDTDHRTAAQRTYFDWMRQHNRYTLPESAGVDPAGWTAGLRHFVDDRYRLVASRSFGAALRSAVTRIRLTGLPVALTVADGGHGWILSGFSATADPASTDDFEVTSVRVVGSLYGLQSKNGYDMRPGTSLSVARLRRFFTPWDYDPQPMVWDGRYVSIQPVPAKTLPEAQAVTPEPSAIPAPSPSPLPSSTADPTRSSMPEPSSTPSRSPGPIAVAILPTPSSSVRADAVSKPADTHALSIVVAVAVAIGVAAVTLLLGALGRSRRGGRRDQA